MTWKEKRRCECWRALTILREKLVYEGWEVMQLRVQSQVPKSMGCVWNHRTLSFGRNYQLG